MKASLIDTQKAVMPVVSSLLGILGAGLGLFVTQRYLTTLSLPEPTFIAIPSDPTKLVTNVIRDLTLADDEMCGITTGGMEECWWGCTWKTKVIPWIGSYDVSLHNYN